MTTAFLIEAGKVTPIELPGNTFDAIREVICGYIEPITSDDGRVTLWCNEDGKPLMLPANAVATSLWRKVKSAAPRDDRLRGPVVVTGAQDGDDILPAPADLEAMFESWVNP